MWKTVAENILKLSTEVVSKVVIENVAETVEAVESEEVVVERSSSP